MEYVRRFILLQHFLNKKDIPQIVSGLFLEYFVEIYPVFACQKHPEW